LPEAMRLAGVHFYKCLHKIADCAFHRLCLVWSCVRRG